MSNDLQSPILLNWDNFTPLTRTPWAGGEIYRRFKQHLPQVFQQMIGESWEISCDESFPSKAFGRNKSLRDIIQSAPERALSPGYIKQTGKNEIEVLVKLIHASAPLSLQVHPQDGDESLLPGECGKPESWLILDAADGAGIYLGFSKSMSKSFLLDQIQKNGDLREYLQFVPVKKGDYFEIQPGTPHAIGAGVILLEPQRVRSGLSGKTYRLWDWGRRYNASGQEDPDGQPRELHINEAMPLLDPQEQVGLAFVDSLRRLSRETFQGLRGEKCISYPKNKDYQLHLFSAPASSSCKLRLEDGYAGMIQLGGISTVKGVADSPVKVQKGQSVFLPYEAGPFSFTASEETGCEFALIVPSAAVLHWT